MPSPTKQLVPFDREKHEYRAGGRQLFGVTTVLKRAGIVDDEWWNEQARDRGSKVHDAIQFLDEGCLDWDKLDPALVGYVQADPAAAHDQRKGDARLAKIRGVERWGARLRADGTYSQKQYKDPDDEHVFLAALTCAGWISKHRRR